MRGTAGCQHQQPPPFAGILCVFNGVYQIQHPELQLLNPLHQNHLPWLQECHAVLGGQSREQPLRARSDLSLSLSLSLPPLPSRNSFFLLPSFLSLFYISLCTALTVLKCAFRLFCASVYCWTICTLPAINRNRPAARTGKQPKPKLSWIKSLGSIFFSLRIRDSIYR